MSENSENKYLSTEAAKPGGDVGTYTFWLLNTKKKNNNNSYLTLLKVLRINMINWLLFAKIYIFYIKILCSSDHIATFLQQSLKININYTNFPLLII